MVRFIILCLFSCLILSVKAEQRIDAYRIDTFVANQTEAERNAAAQATLGDVIFRVTGDATSLQHPLVRQAIANAPNYVLKFSYSADGEKNATDGVKITLNYSPQAIEALLRQAQLNLWPSNRPAVLLWLVGNDGGNYRQLTDDASWQIINQRAQLRGLPLIVPKWDGDDAQILSAQSVWNLDVEKIKSASQRYNEDLILVGRYNRVGTTWKVSWQLLRGAESTHFDSQIVDAKKTELTDLFTNGIDQVANHLAQIYAIKPTQQGPQTVTVQVSNVKDFAAFKQVQAYLKTVAMIQRSELLNANNDVLLYKLILEGDVTLLKSTLALSKKWQVDEMTSSAAQSQPAQLAFRWQN